MPKRAEHRNTGGAEGKMVRAFLAVPLPAELLEPIRKLQRELADRLPGVRWTRSDTMHLTLKFFGDLPEEVLDKIGEVMLSVGRLHSPFRVRLAGVGAFPGPARPRVIWLGIEEGEKLVDLFAAFDRELENIGIPAETRPFSPHLTLGRCRQPGRPAGAVLEPLRRLPCGLLPVEKVILYESRLRPEGAVHRPLQSVLLGRAERS